ncbi:hypothetical protein CAPTEDRAFT_186481 [Capitella teleta]|uniref:Reverse transcriptase domain-containing protein n=1 Tax=Capitella teleta TaxID=283909 RepID=R7U3T7_CAPTE|nr:hypothetical protein CAPTEDRAFT_186481 [Capitella teleta]|eukprot:ELT98321.1 hypothetical protein CAPTEDRAFT_186481 [Capitella teleta]
MEEGFRFERMGQNFDHVAEMHDFWTQVQKMKNSAAQHPNSVDGARSDVEIVSVFKQKYSNLYNSVGYDHRVLDDTRDRVNELFSSHKASDCHVITLHEVKTVVSQLKRNKHDGLAGLSTDHLKNAPQLFLSHLTTFFNGLLTHGFSPDDFNVAVLIPIPKNKPSGAGCWLSGRFCGSFAYADDVILLAPSRKALACMLRTCANFASDFKDIFNASKSKLILYNVSDTVPVPFMNNYLDIVPTEKHLGFPLGASSNKHLIENLCKEIMSKTNMLYCNFKHLPIDALYKLFRTYCTPRLYLARF